MGAYLSFYHDRDSIDSAGGAAYLVLTTGGLRASEAHRISHSCGSPAELDFVLRDIERDIALIRRQAKRSFAAHHERKTRKLEE